MVSDLSIWIAARFESGTAPRVDESSHPGFSLLVGLSGRSVSVDNEVLP